MRQPTIVAAPTRGPGRQECNDKEEHGCEVRKINLCTALAVTLAARVFLLLVIAIGAKVTRHAKYVFFQLGEVENDNDW